MKKSIKTLGGGALKAKTSKRAFTLAEVLITLAIIGVVAALTIPVLVGKYQKHQLYTQFMKVFNTLSSAIQLSLADNGDIVSWDYSEPNKIFDKYFLDYLKVINTKPVPDYDVYSLDGEKFGKFSEVLSADSEGTNSENIYYFADGSSCAIAGAFNGGDIVFACDTNGDKKPNTLGRDIFTFRTNPRDNSFAPEFKSGDNNDACIISGNGGEVNIKGIGCGDRLLAEGKMDY